MRVSHESFRRPIRMREQTLSVLYRPLPTSTDLVEEVADPLRGEQHDHERQRVLHVARRLAQHARTHARPPETMGQWWDNGTMV